AAAMNARAIKASPSALSTTWRTNHALRLLLPPALSAAAGVRPLSIASATRPVASGPAKNETADPRSSRSLASWSRTRQNASIDRAGPRPTGMSCEIAMTWNAAPAQGNAIVNARGAGRPPRNGASTNADANPYSANAMRCRVTITADPGQAHQRGPGGLSGRHLLDQPYGKTRLQRGVADLQQETGGGFFARVHDHHHGAHFFRCRARIQLGRFIYLEDVTNGDPVPTALVDEIELLRAGDRVRVARAEQLAREPLCHRCGTHLP